ncbi:MAG: phage portal protein, partial [Proteobacteria bacterium]|nr:phage portal protein [Pseudomonadota bacterium]
GWMAPNEARAGENLRPAAGGDSPYLQQQNYSLAALAKRDTKADPFATGPKPEPAAPEVPVPAPAPAAANDGKAVLEAAALLADIFIKGLEDAPA